MDSTSLGQFKFLWVAGVWPVIEVGAVSEILAAQLARFSDVSQAVDELALYRVVLTELVKVLPCLAAPVSADLLTHVPATVQCVLESNTFLLNCTSACCKWHWTNAFSCKMPFWVPADWGVCFGAAMQFGTVHLGRMWSIHFRYGRRVGTAQKALPHRLLRERLGATFLDQTLHNLVLCAHGAKDSPAGHLAVGSCPVTAV